MAETPKGDTITPTAETEQAGPTGARPGRGASSSDAGAGVPADTIAGGTGGDSLAVGSGESEAPERPWSATRPASRPVAAPEPAPADRSAGPGRPGALRRLAIPAVLVILVAGGAYATYPMWRAEFAPYAGKLGITLPGPRVAEAPAPAPVAPPSPAPEPAPAPAQPPAPPATAADPALAGDVDRLTDRLGALEQRVAEIETRPAQVPAPASPPAEPSAELRERLETMSDKLAAVTDEVAIVREGLAGSGGGEGLGPLAAQLSGRLQGLTDRITAIEERSQAQQDLAVRVAAIEERAGAAQGLADRIAAVEGRSQAIQDLAGRIATLENQPAAAAVTPERLEAVQARIDALSGRLDDEVRKGADDVSRLESRLTGIDSRLEQIAKALEATRGSREKAGAFLMAANQLAAAAGRSGGFAPELGALRTAAPADPDVAAALETLAGHAGGVPSLAMLRDRFARTATAAIDASVVGSGEGVIGQALTRMASLVTIRRTATDAGDGLDALLLRAEAALAAGDLPAAIEAVRRLDGDPAKAAAAWLADAEARAAVDAAVRTLQAKSLSGVAGG